MDLTNIKPLGVPMPEGGRWTLQQVFDNALFGVRRQNYQRSTASGTRKGVCQYRSVSVDGHTRACGIGWSIPDALVPMLAGVSTVGQWVNETPMRVLAAEAPEIAAVLPRRQSALVAMQAAHDAGLDPLEGGGPEVFERSMKRIADSYGLTYAAA